MPANPKYLTTSALQKTVKIFSGVVGGYIISAFLHLALYIWLPFGRDIFTTSTYTLFLVWIALLVVPFLFENGYKVFVIYTLIALLLAVAIYCGNI